ncbi:MAG: hypothetical protein J5I81_09300 [Nitrococcus mobilis]|nr:hypothetical protein [Nitrococcus mobilis]
MKMGLFACTALGALVCVAQAAPEPGNTSGPLRLTAPQLDIATAGSVNVWISSAGAGAQLTQLDEFGLTGTNNSNIQLVISVSGLREGSLAGAKKIIIPSSPGGSVSIGQTIFVGEPQ